MGDALTGKTAKKQYNLAAAAQAQQAALLAEQERKIAAVEAGQRALISGGGGGLLAYIDKPAGSDTGTNNPLKKLFGGGAEVAA